MKSEDFIVKKDGKRVDDHILSIDFKNSTVCYTDKKSRVNWDIFPDEVKVEYVKDSKKDSKQD